MKNQYVGLTYSKRENPKKWDKVKCKRGEHLLDEVLSLDHVLSCDACGLIVRIAEIIKPKTKRYREYQKNYAEGKRKL